MRTWEFRIIIEEGLDEFWEGYTPVYDKQTETPRGYATCEEVEDLLRSALESMGIEADVKLTKMINDDD